MASKPKGPFDSSLIPSQLQVEREELARLGTPQPLDRWNVEVVGDLHNKDEGEGDYEYSWSITEAEDKAAHACQYELDLIWASLMMTSNFLNLDCCPIYQSAV